MFIYYLASLAIRYVFLITDFVLRPLVVEIKNIEIMVGCVGHVQVLRIIEHQVVVGSTGDASAVRVNI